MQVKSTVKFDWGVIRKLEAAQITALEQTAEFLHTEVVQAQVMPFDTGNLQNESTFVDDSKSKEGKVTIAHNTPYARRMYYHPEYHFQKRENPNARGKWYADWLTGGSREKDCQKAYAQFYKRLMGV